MLLAGSIHGGYLPVAGFAGFTGFAGHRIGISVYMESFSSAHMLC